MKVEHSNASLAARASAAAPAGDLFSTKLPAVTMDVTRTFSLWERLTIRSFQKKLSWAGDRGTLERVLDRIDREVTDPAMRKEISNLEGMYFYDGVNRTSWPPAHYCLKKQGEELTMRVIDLGADLSRTVGKFDIGAGGNERFSFLHLLVMTHATRRVSETLINKALQRCKDPDQRDDRQRTPLYHAMQMGYQGIPLMVHLVKYGATFGAFTHDQRDEMVRGWAQGLRVPDADALTDLYKLACVNKDTMQFVREILERRQLYCAQVGEKSATENLLERCLDLHPSHLPPVRPEMPLLPALSTTVAQPERMGAMDDATLRGACAKEAFADGVTGAIRLNAAYAELTDLLNQYCSPDDPEAPQYRQLAQRLYTAGQLNIERALDLHRWLQRAGIEEVNEQIELLTAERSSAGNESDREVLDLRIGALLKQTNQFQEMRNRLVFRLAAASQIETDLRGATGTLADIGLGKRNSETCFQDAASELRACLQAAAESSTELETLRSSEQGQ